MREKRGLEALAQATSMVLMVSALIHLYLHQVGTCRTPNNALVFSSSLSFLVRCGSGLGARGLRPASKDRGEARALHPCHEEESPG